MALRFGVFLLEMKGMVSAVLDIFACMILHNRISYRYIKSFWRKTRHESFCTIGASLVAQTVQNLSAMQETQVWSLGGEDPIEKGMATHSSIIAWRIPWTEESDRLQSMGLQRVRHNWETNSFTFCIIMCQNIWQNNIHTKKKKKKVLQLLKGINQKTEL